MGKGTILSDLGAGQYRIEINYARADLTAQITKLTEQIVAFNATTAALLITMNVAEVVRDGCWDEVDDAISDYSFNPSPENKAVVVARTDLAREKQLAYEIAVSNYELEKLRKLVVEKRLAELQDAVPSADPQADAWCADYSEGLTGEVGLIEADRTRTDALPIVYPAGNAGSAAAYSGARDGTLQAPMVMTPESAYYNVAVLPGVEKWQPMYRLGEITGFNGNIATVELDALVSTQQLLNVNQTATVDAPIEYMSCNETVFEVGDRVVVAFVGQSWAQPKVIGFESNPRACYSDMVLVFYASYPVTSPIFGAVIDKSLDSLYSVWLKTGDRAFMFGPGDISGGQYLSTRGYRSVGGGLTPWPLVVYDNDALIIEIDDIATTPPDIEKAGDGVVSKNSTMFFCMYALWVNKFINGNTIYAETHFATYDSSINRITKKILTTWTSPNQSINYSPARYFFIESSANDAGVLTFYADIPQGNALEGAIYKVVLFDTVGNVIATIDGDVDGSINNKYISLAANDSGLFFVLYQQTGILNSYNAAGDVLDTQTVAAPAAPTPPAGVSVAAVLYRRLCADNASVSIINCFEYADGTNPLSGSKAQLIVQRYKASASGIMVHQATSAVLQQDQFFASIKADRI